MNKEKDKQAIAKLLYGHYCGDDICGQCKIPHCDCYMIAEKIVNAGFGQCSEMSEPIKVTNKSQQIEELEKELELAENYPFYKNRHDIAAALVERGYGNVEQIRKEVVQEILQDLENRIWDDIDTNSDIGGREHNDTINGLIMLIKHKYGIEVE